MKSEFKQMKALDEIEQDVLALANMIDASGYDLPTYGTSRDFGYPHIEVERGRYHYIVRDHGQELSRRSCTEYEDLLYWIFRDVTHILAFRYELQHRVPDKDCRRIAFAKQLELMNSISPVMGKRLNMDIADILRHAPYDDTRTQSLNRMRQEIP